MKNYNVKSKKLKIQNIKYQITNKHQIPNHKQITNSKFKCLNFEFI